MIYSLNKSAIHIYDRNEINMFQEKNARTQKAFKDDVEALDYVKSILEEYYNLTELELLDIGLKDLNGVLIEDIKEFEKFQITIKIPTTEKDIDNITITLNSNNFSKKYDIPIIKGEGVIELALQEGIYRLEFDDIVGDNRYILHEADDFVIVVKP